MGMFSLPKKHGISIGKRHKGKVIGGIGYETPKTPKVKKPKREKLPPTLGELRRREGAKRKSRAKTKKMPRKIWRTLTSGKI